MANIFCRSPYLIRIADTGQLGSKIELRIWRGYGGSAPTNPTYTLSKLIPAPTVYETLYNISPYIKEFISHPFYFNVYNQVEQNNNDYEWANVEVKSYKLTNEGYVLLSTVTYKAFDGYNEYLDGKNFDRGNYHLDEGIYLYEYDSNSSPSSNVLKRAGAVIWNGVIGNKVKYTELSTGNTQTFTITKDRSIMSYRVYPSYYSNGNIMQILNASNTVLWESTFKPIVECKYTPVVIDFINKYGAWQREFFFKASKNTINVNSTTYNLMQESVWNFDEQEGQRKVFNSIMAETIQVNSDWRDDNYSEVIRQLMMSERIFINNNPVKINTNSMEMFKQINTKMINYQLDFEYAYDINNTVV